MGDLILMYFGNTMPATDDVIGVVRKLYVRDNPCLDEMILADHLDITIAEATRLKEIFPDKYVITSASWKLKYKKKLKNMILNHEEFFFIKESKYSIYAIHEDSRKTIRFSDHPPHEWQKNKYAQTLDMVGRSGDDDRILEFLNAVNKVNRK